jgi:hypothetical protein
MKKQAKPGTIADAMKLLASWNKYIVSMLRMDGKWTVSITRHGYEYETLGEGASDHLNLAIWQAVMQAREEIK